MVLDVVEICAKWSEQFHRFGPCCAYRYPHSSPLVPSSYSSLALECACRVRCRMTLDVVRSSVRIRNSGRVLTRFCMWEEGQETDRCFCALGESTSNPLSHDDRSLNDEGFHVDQLLVHSERAHVAVRRRRWSRRPSHRSSRLSPWLDDRRREREMGRWRAKERGDENKGTNNDRSSKILYPV